MKISNKEIVKKLKERIVLFESFIKDKKVTYDSYNSRIKEDKRVLNLIQKNKLTPAQFDKLKNNHKWDIYHYFLKKHVIWMCKSCKSPCDIESAFFDDSSIHCSNCDAELTHRTGGGQNNPFNWSFRYKK